MKPTSNGPVDLDALDALDPDSPWNGATGWYTPQRARDLHDRALQARRAVERVKTDEARLGVLPPAPASPASDVDAGSDAPGRAAAPLPHTADHTRKDTPS